MSDLVLLRFILIALFGAGLLAFWQLCTDARPLPVAVLADGSEYRGELVDGVLQGQGELRRADGSIYRGGFVDGLFSGHGHMVYANGDEYIGQWQRGVYQGQGEYRDDFGVYSGEFETGHFTGRGQYLGDDGSRYVGDFVDWQFQGRGELTDADGNRWRGQFNAGQLEGEGEYIGRDGSNYRGEFSQGNFHGSGRYQFAGDVYRGEFAYGSYHGEGELTYAEPVAGVIKVSGRWEYGELVEDDDTGATQGEVAEQLLYSQQARLEQVLGLLAEQNPERIDLYFLGVAGDGNQRVFARELNSVSDLFARQFTGRDRQLLLINGRDHGAPLATRRSIELGLRAMAEKMDSAEDILFVYLTSHGSRDHHLVLDQPGIELPDLAASDFAAKLQALPVKYKVVVVSSCYSGGFIAPLADDNTLVMTAAAADKTSFGCSDANTMTWFGEALFNQSLAGSDDFIAAFARAKDLIAEKEAAEQLPPSEPQIAAGSAVVRQLQRWRAQRGMAGLR